VDIAGRGDKHSGVVSGERLSDCPRLTELIEAARHMCKCQLGIDSRRRDVTLCDVLMLMTFQRHFCSVVVVELLTDSNL